MNNDNSIKDTFRLSFDRPVYVSDIAMHIILDKAFIKDESYVTMYMHSHPYYEVHICTKGRYKISFMDGKSIIMKPSAICLIPPRIYHSTEKLDVDGQNLPICFTYKQIKQEGKKLYDTIHRRFLELQSPVMYFSKQIVKIVNDMRYEIMHKNFASEVLVQLLISQLYVQLFRLMVPAEGNGLNGGNSADNQEERYLRIDSYLQNNFSKNITIDDVAECLSVSKRQICRVIKKIYGITFLEKITELRLIKAAELLADTDMPVGDIAVDVGYSSYSGFSGVFKKRYGITARQYRAKNRR